MNDSRKTRVILVVAANVVLSAIIGLAIYNGAGAVKKAESVSQKTETNTAAPVAEAKPAETASNSAVDTISSGTKYPKTDREIVAAVAKRAAGRRDPMEPLNEQASYPGLTSNQLAAAPKKQSKPVEYKEFVPPPPPTPVDMQIEKTPKHLSSAVPEQLTVEHKMMGVKITGIIGNKAIFLMRREGSSRTERPEVICLAPGEQVKTVYNVPISVLEVDKDRVTLEVDGDRMVKSLPEIR